MRYEIDDQNAIRVFDDKQDAPFVFQPDWPDGTPWSDADEARSWAEVLIESLENPNSAFVPGVSPAEHPTPRPESKKVDPETGLTAEEIAAITGA